MSKHSEVQTIIDEANDVADRALPRGLTRVEYVALAARALDYAGAKHSVGEVYSALHEAAEEEQAEREEARQARDRAPHKGPWIIEIWCARDSVDWRVSRAVGDDIEVLACGCDTTEDKARWAAREAIKRAQACAS